MRSVKVGFRGAVQPLAVALARAGIQANWLTYLGFVLNVAVAVLVSQGWFGVGGAAFLIVNALDFLDGAVARAAGTAGAFGAFLDSVLDRYSEAVVFVGLVAAISGMTFLRLPADAGAEVSGKRLGRRPEPPAKLSPSPGE